jgi:Flp pilus assembly protein TadG
MCKLLKFRDFGRWVGDASGTVALTFALLAIAIFGVVGLALDSSRAYDLSRRTTTTLDAAALASARVMVAGNATDEEVIAVAKSYITANFSGASFSGLTVSDPVVTIDRAAEEVTVQMIASVQSTIGKVIGVNTFEFDKASTASFAVQDIELGLMLDVSGSMGSGGKLADLKNAVHTLLDKVMQDRAHGPVARVGFAPYSNSINIGSYATKAKGIGTTNSCVSERKWGEGAFSDDPPAPGKLIGGKATSCPTSEIVPITSDRDTLDTALAALSASGMTAGHLGVAWAWYLVSPKWGGIWPSESTPVGYGDKSATKAVILMTDGMFNTEYEPGNGSSADQALLLCENIKAAGVKVFTVSFQAPVEVLPLMETCASGPEYYFNASNGGALEAAFSSIAETLLSIRLKS